MSNNALVLDRSPSEAFLFDHPAPVREVPGSGEYLELIRRHFHTHSVVAIVPVGSGRGAGEVCADIAAELTVAGNRVVIVSVDALLRRSPVATPEGFGCTAARTPNSWLWPSAAGGRLEFFKSPGPADPAASWLDSLRLTFDAVLLDCPAAETASSAAQFAAMADAALLVVEAGRTTRQQIQRDQRALQLRSVKVAGSILIQTR